MKEEVKCLESTSHTDETCIQSIANDDLKSSLNMTLIHGHNLHDERTKPMEEINKYKLEEINVKTAMRLTERAENVPKTEGIYQEEESTGIAIEHEIKASDTSEVRHKKEVINLTSNEMGKEVGTETVASLVRENHKESAESQMTPKTATETNIFSHIQEGVCFNPSEQVQPEPVFSSNSEKSKAINVPRTTEVANQIPTSEGTHIEAEVVLDLTSENNKGISAKASSLKSKVNKFAKKVANKIGSLVEAESAETFAEPKKAGRASESKSKGIAKEISQKIPVQEGVISVSSEAISSLETNEIMKPEKSKVKAAKSKTARAENVPIIEGLVIEKETVGASIKVKPDGELANISKVKQDFKESVIQFPNEIGISEETDSLNLISELKNDSVTSIETKVKRLTQNAEKIAKSIGINLEDETVDVCDDRYLVEKTVDTLKTRSQSQETVTLVPSEVGLMEESETVAPVPEQNTQVEDRAKISLIKKKNEKAKKIPKSAGFNLEEETTDIYSERKMEEKTVGTSEIRSHSKETAILVPSEIGIAGQSEIVKPITRQEEQLEKSKVTTVTKKRERAKKIPKSEGVHCMEERAESHLVESPKANSVESYKVRSNSKGKVKLVSKEVGIADELEALKPLAIQEETAREESGLVSKEENKNPTEYLSQQTSIILGQCDNILSAEELSIYDVQEQKADIKSSIMDKNISSKMPTEVGLAILPSSTEDFSITPKTIETPKVERAKPEWKLATRTEKIIGCSTNSELVEDFKADSVNKEFSQTSKERDYESYRQVPHIQGFEPVENSVEDILSSEDINKHSAQETRTRSISRERTARIPLSVGFRAKENKTEYMADISSDSCVAKIKNEDHEIGGMVKKISLVGGFSHDFDKSAPLATKPLEESMVDPKIVKIKRERASSLGRTVGFHQPVELVKPNQDSIKQEEQTSNVSKVAVERDLASRNDVTLVVRILNI